MLIAMLNLVAVHFNGYRSSELVDYISTVTAPFNLFSVTAILSLLTADFDGYCYSELADCAF